MNERRLQIQSSLIEHTKSETNDSNKYVQYVGNLFTFYLPPVSADKTRKLLIELHEEQDAFFIFPKEKNQELYTIRETFDFSAFNASSSMIKISALVESAFQCLLKLYEHLGWNLKNVQTGYELICQNNYFLELEICGGAKLNKRREVKAVVLAEHTLEYTLLKVNFLNPDNSIVSTTPLFKVLPVYSFYSRICHSAKWLNNDEFQILNQTREFGLKVNLNGEYEVIYNPRGRDIEGVKEELTFITSEVFINI